MGADKKSGPPPKPAAPQVRISRTGSGLLDPRDPRSPGKPSEADGAAQPIRRIPVRIAAEAPGATTRRAPIRLLLRPQINGSIGPSLNGEVVIPVGPAAPETWGAAWREGDEEAMVWVPAPRVNDVMSELRQDPRIIDVRVSMRDVK